MAALPLLATGCRLLRLVVWLLANWPVAGLMTTTSLRVKLLVLTGSLKTNTTVSPALPTVPLPTRLMATVGGVVSTGLWVVSKLALTRLLSSTISPATWVLALA